MNEIDELRALQAFRADLDVPPPAALARIHARAFETPPAVRLSTGRRLTLAAVAASVVAIAVVVSLVAGLGTPPKPPANPTPSPTASEIIEHLAQVAAAEPPGPAVGPDDVIEFTNIVYRATGQSGNPSVQETDLSLMSVVGPHQINPPPPGQPQIHTPAQLAAFLAQYRAEMASEGQAPSPSYMTPEWLAGLDPEPTALRRDILAAKNITQGGQCPSCRSASDVNWALFGYVDEMVWAGGDAMLTPRLRAGLLRMVGQIPGVTADREIVFGHNVWALSLADDAIGHRNQLYIDPATGHVIGDSWRRTGHRADPSTCKSYYLYPGRNEPTAGPCLWVTYPPSQQPYNGQQLFFASLVTFTQGLAFPVTQPGN